MTMQATTGITIPKTTNNKRPVGLVEASANGAMKPFKPRPAMANGTFKWKTPTATIADKPAIKAGPNINNGLFNRFGNWTFGVTIVWAKLAPRSFCVQPMAV